MIAWDADTMGLHGADLPAATRGVRVELGEERLLELLVVPCATSDDGTDAARLAAVVGRWVAAVTPPAPPASHASPAATEAAVARPPVMLPLYGCHVAWAPGRAAVVGPPDRLAELEAAVVEFATREAELAAVEARVDSLLTVIDDDAAVAFECDDRGLVRRPELSARFREAIDIRRRLALLAPRVQPPSLQPPTLAAQVGERLRERSRLAERLDQAADRADLAERVYEACGQRVSELGIARRQLGLEWAIVILLVLQTVLLLVDLLASRAAS